MGFLNKALDWALDLEKHFGPFAAIPVCILLAFALPFLLFDPTPTNGTSGRLGGIALGCVGWLIIGVVTLTIYSLLI